MRIEDGQAEQHPTPLPLDASHSPGVAPATPAFASGTAQGGARDLTGERLSQLASNEDEIAAAQSFGMSADGSRRQHYLATVAPLGASAGDLMPLSSPPLDPAAAPGEAEPWGALYTPPRGY